MSLALERAEKLAALTEKIEQDKERIGASLYNGYVMKMSQILVPLNYVEGSNYEHDLAVRGNEMPVLSVLDCYQNVDAGSDDWKLVNVVAVRRINKVNHELKKAIELAESYLK